VPKKQKPLPPRHKRLNRAGRLQAGRRCLASYNGKRVLRGYARHFGVDLGCALIEMQMLGGTFAPEYVEALQATLAARKRASQQRPKDTFPDEEPWFPGDEEFAVIVGRTEAGFAYGVTWDEMAALEATTLAGVTRAATGPSTMRLESAEALLEIGRVEWATPGPTDEDLLLNVTIRSYHYSADGKRWVVAEDWQRFLCELRVLEERRQGSAVLVGASPDDLRIQFFSTDYLGHMAVRGHVGWSAPGGHRQRLQFGFDFEPDRLPAVLAGFVGLAAQRESDPFG
jgi:hypothetical protein